MNVWSILVPYNQPRRIASFSRLNVSKPTISIPLWETFSLQVSGEIPRLLHPSHPPQPHLHPSLPKTPFVLKTINSPQITLLLVQSYKWNQNVSVQATSLNQPGGGSGEHNLPTFQLSSPFLPLWRGTWGIGVKLRNLEHPFLPMNSSLSGRQYLASPSCLGRLLPF